MNRGFIQIAGFTLGKATSFFDIFPNASFAYNAGNNWSGDSGDGGVILASYTAQFGNGFSGTIGIEHQRRGTPTVYTIGATGTALAPYTLAALAPANNNGGVAGTYPDIVGNLRLDQSWGTWIVAAALHEISGGYFGPAARDRPPKRSAIPATSGAGRPPPASSGTCRLSLPAIGSRRRWCTLRARRNTTPRPAAAPSRSTSSGNRVSWGMWEDAVFAGNAAANAFSRTTAWSVNAAFEHLWTPSLKTSLYGSYIDVSHSAAGTAIICAGNDVATASIRFSAATCNPDWSCLDGRFAHRMGARQGLHRRRGRDLPADQLGAGEQRRHRRAAAARRQAGGHLYRRRPRRLGRRVPRAAQLPALIA